MKWAWAETEQGELDQSVRLELKVDFQKNVNGAQNENFGLFKV